MPIESSRARQKWRDAVLTAAGNKGLVTDPEGKWDSSSDIALEELNTFYSSFKTLKAELPGRAFG